MPLSTIAPGPAAFNPVTVDVAPGLIGPPLVVVVAFDVVDNPKDHPAGTDRTDPVFATTAVYTPPAAGV